jgi:hypothetical protein
LQLDHTHCRAICDEIGEQLRDTLAREIGQTPAHLRTLLERLAQLDGAPSIVPAMDDMASLRGPLALALGVVA